MAGGVARAGADGQEHRPRGRDASAACRVAGKGAAEAATHCTRGMCAQFRAVRPQPARPCTHTPTPAQSTGSADLCLRAILCRARRGGNPLHTGTKGGSGRVEGDGIGGTGYRGGRGGGRGGRGGGRGGFSGKKEDDGRRDVKRGFAQARGGAEKVTQHISLAHLPRAQAKTASAFRVRARCRLA